ncbi:hypothetical protein CLV56_0557 [Mumia flava]|uniref:LPXTG-motif cell wall-anchored protein n=1 Tax=Mumia flava TaxID=1348852 RepID=A0A0B2BL11_9ACTN|nr:hypothetical protein [Mumia flava]PJJ56351.1 hypothetical protein CLV56_0557 [Mumia flava]
MSARARRSAALRVVASAVLAAGALVLTSPPAQAVAPTGGCWVWYAGTPSSNISTSLAPWADAASAPAGPADHTITLSPSDPAPGQRVTIEYAFNKGPKNGGPAAAVAGTFTFSVNDGTEVTASKDFGTVAGGAAIPGSTVTTSFVAVEGDNDVRLEGAVFRATAFDIRIDCNGQTSGTAQTNPRTAPLPTNVTASVVASGDPVDPEPTTAPTTTPPTTTPTTAPTSAPTSAATTAPTTSTPTAAREGEPATGDVTFACTLEPLGTEFDYPAEISVLGYRAADSDPVTLQGELSDLPGIAPLPINGTMDVTLDLVAGGQDVTLSGGGHVEAATKAPVPVPVLTGEMTSEEAEIDMAVTGFTFDFPDLDISADCTGDAELSRMVVGSEVPPDGGDGGGGDGDGSGGGDGGGTASGGGTLPQTGGTDGLVVAALWAGALLLLGSAGLVLVPGRRRTAAGG